MPNYTPPILAVASFNEEENKILNNEFNNTVSLIESARNNNLLADYHPPILSAPGLSDEENADMNKEIEKAMRHTIETGGPDALGVIATTVIATTVGSVVGSVAATIVSKKLDDGMVVPDNFEIEVVDGGGFFVGTEPPMPEDFDLTIISSGEI